jgi:hypothetical protein
MTPESAKPPTGIRGFDLQIHRGRVSLRRVLGVVANATTAHGGMRGDVPCR